MQSWAVFNFLLTKAAHQTYDGVWKKYMTTQLKHSKYVHISLLAD